VRSVVPGGQAAAAGVTQGLWVLKVNDAVATGQTLAWVTSKIVDRKKAEKDAGKRGVGRSAHLILTLGEEPICEKAHAVDQATTALKLEHLKEKAEMERQLEEARKKEAEAHELRHQHEKAAMVKVRKEFAIKQRRQNQIAGLESARAYLRRQGREKVEAILKKHCEPPGGAWTEKYLSSAGLAGILKKLKLEETLIQKFLLKLMKGDPTCEKNKTVVPKARFLDWICFSKALSKSPLAMFEQTSAGKKKQDEERSRKGKEAAEGKKTKMAAEEEKKLSPSEEAAAAIYG